VFWGVHGELAVEQRGVTSLMLVLVIDIPELPQPFPPFVPAKTPKEGPLNEIPLQSR
jgi:hypothetical protein